jgi:3-oxoacyl-[acyl-carrier-protein] synthase III
MAANTYSQIPSRNGTGIYAHLVGWGMAVPEGILTNEDLEAIIETNDEWIRTRTGIRERHIASDRETTSVLALKAAQRALEVADILPMELDLIIVATSTPEFVFPSTASLIQDWLGANKAGAFDLSAACSGFVYGVNMAAQSIRSGSLQTALVIGAETMSKVVNWQDRGTCILFGDGAGAVVLRANEVEGGVLSAVMRSDGAGCDLLTLPSVGNTKLNSTEFAPDGQRFHKMYMAGGEVFKFATRVFSDSIREAVDLAGITLDDISLIVPHQANQRILQSAARSLKIDKSRFMSNIERYGNTSAASIPIALAEAVQKGLIHEGDYIAFVGFGAGLAWASMVIKWGIPQPQERQGTRFNRQRRRFYYTLARWRAALIRGSRQINETINRIRPERGRVPRLRRKIDHHDLE